MGQPVKNAAVSAIKWVQRVLWEVNLNSLFAMGL